MKFAALMSSPGGRTTRIVAGLVVFVLAFFTFSVSVVLMIALMLVGILVIAAGASNTCYFAPLFGGPLDGNSLNR
ncbi:MAG: hypothetical protein ACOYBP_06315 [Microbacteriaceae bacterium]